MKNIIIATLLSITMAACVSVPPEVLKADAELKTVINDKQKLQLIETLCSQSTGIDNDICRHNQYAKHGLPYDATVIMLGKQQYNTAMYKLNNTVRQAQINTVIYSIDK